MQQAISTAKDNLLFYERHYDYLKNYFTQLNGGSG